MVNILIQLMDYVTLHPVNNYLTLDQKTELTDEWGNILSHSNRVNRLSHFQSSCQII